MSTHLPGFQSFSAFSHHFVLAKLPTTSIRVKVKGKLRMGNPNKSTTNKSTINLQSNSEFPSYKKYYRFR